MVLKNMFLKLEYTSMNQGRRILGDTLIETNKMKAIVYMHISTWWWMLMNKTCWETLKSVLYDYQPWVIHKAILNTTYSRSSDGMGFSNTPASKLSIASLNMSDRVSWVAEPICGSKVTFDMFANGWSGCIGSGIITSSPAPLIFPDCNENIFNVIYR